MSDHSPGIALACGDRADLRDRLIAAADETLTGLRDRALIALGYDTLCRRSEIVLPRVEDISSLGDGSATILVRRSKTDQQGQGRLAYISPPTLQLILKFTQAANLSEGYLFRAIRGTVVGSRSLNASTVPRIVKRLAQKADIDAATVARLSGHSFRVGAALDMTERGIGLVPIMHAGGWKSPEMVGRYTQQIDVMRSGMALLHQRGA